MSWKIRRMVNITLCCVGLVMLFTSSSQIAEGIRDGLMLCAQVVIPSLFPFMVMSEFASRTGSLSFLLRPLTKLASPLFRLPRQACESVLLSFFSGYPTGAALVSRLLKNGVIDPSTAARMMTYCVNAGPAMIVFAVGGCLLGSVKIGWILLACHLAASVIIGAVGARFSPAIKSTAHKPTQTEGLADAFVNSTASSCQQMLTICGFVTLFSAVLSALPKEAGFLFPLIEVTKGCEWLASNGFGAPVIAAALGFGGLSVIFQVMRISQGCVSFVRLIISRLCHAALSAVLCALLIHLCPSVIETASNGVAVLAGYRTTMIPCTLAMLLTASTMLWTASCKN